MSREKGAALLLLLLIAVSVWNIRAADRLCSSLNEVVRALLEGDTAEECYNLVIHTALWPRLTLVSKAYGVVNSHNTLCRHAIAVDNDISCKV